MFGTAPLGSTPYGLMGKPLAPNAIVLGSLGAIVLTGQQPVVFRGVIATPPLGRVTLIGLQGLPLASSTAAGAGTARLTVIGQLGSTLTAAVAKGGLGRLTISGRSPTLYSSNTIPGLLGQISLTPKAGATAASSTSVASLGALHLTPGLGATLAINTRRRAQLITMLGL